MVTIRIILSTLFVVAALAVGGAVGHFALGGNQQAPASAVTTPTNGGGTTIPAGVTVATGGNAPIPMR